MTFHLGIHCLPFTFWDAGFDNMTTVKPVLSGHTIRRPKYGFQYQLSLNAGQKYCRMLQWDHTAILSTFIKLPFVIKIFAMSFLSGRFTQVLLYML